MDEAPVLISYDGSAESRQAIADAAVLLSERRAVVVNVAPLDRVAEAYAAAGSGAAALGADVHSDAVVRAEEGAELARQAGFRAEARGILATPLWRGVLEVADEIDAAVIVVGSRVHSRFSELVEEHVSHGVVEHASRPVLIIRAQ
jgi:nucleotide-binding universal stress UspA family protein